MRHFEKRTQPKLRRCRREAIILFMLDETSLHVIFLQVWELRQTRHLWRARIITKPKHSLEKIPGAREHVIRADNSRPETIFHIAQQGFHVEAAEKWPGSVEDGIAWLRAHEQIVIHPRCKRTEEEFRRYRYKTDLFTGDILPIIVDTHNHCIDALRYAFQPAVKVPEQEVVLVYEEPNLSISPELDEFDLKHGFF